MYSYNNSFNSAGVQRLLSSDETITKEDTSFYCKACNKSFTYRSRDGLYNIKRHIQTTKHLEKKARLEGFQSLIVDKPTNPEDEIAESHKDLIHFLAKSNIPLSKIDSRGFRDFAQKYIPFPVRTESYYQTTVLDSVYQDRLNRLKHKLDSKEVYMVVDEITDKEGHHIICLMVGACIKALGSPTYLINVAELPKINNLTVTKFIKDGIKSFFGERFDNNLLRLLVTNQGSYMTLCGKNLQSLYPRLKHVTCLSHLLYGVIEKVQNMSLLVDTFISLLKRLLLKNQTNQELFRSITGMDVPSFQSTTRWGTWIEFSVFLFTYFSDFRDFITAFDKNHSTEYIHLCTSPEFEAQLRLCQEFSFLPEKIKKLESKSFSVEDQIKILKECYDLAKEKEIIKAAFDNLLSKSPDLSFFMGFNNLQVEKENRNLAYVPLVSACVERPFDLYNTMFPDQKQPSAIPNMKKALFLHHNNNL